jgi:hypothetical protein
MKNDTKNYAVSLKICIAGYEKSTTQVVRDADSVEDAIERAIRYESHDRDDDTPPDACGWYDDADGDFSYKMIRIEQIDGHTADTLERFL